jgi:predicted DNA-binding transcriptional regulator AlpA
MPDITLTAKDVAKVLKVSLALVYRMADRGQLPCIRWECPGEGTERPRTMVRFRSEDVRKFLESHYSGSGRD